MKLASTFTIVLSLLLGGAPLLSTGQSLRFNQPVRGDSSQVNFEDERGMIALDQSLREIANPFTVLCVAARPGDQDDGALAYIRKKLGARVAILFVTRGEGEDSPTRAALDQELGALHTREALESARVIGSDLFFLNLRDIGYSKSSDEAISIWGHDEALRRMIRAIRLLRPDVIITRHSSKTGEGVEVAVARLALEAFNEAGNAKVAAEPGADAWQPRRFFERTDETAADLTINLNEYDRPRGLTYAQIGLSAHHRYVSRGAHRDRLTPDREISRYRLINPAGDDKLKPGGSIFDGLTLPENLARSISQPRVGDLGVVEAISTGERLIEALIDKLIEKRAEGTIAEMQTRYGAEFVRVVRFTSAIERALALALGLNLEVSVSDPIVVPGQKLIAHLVLRNRGTRSFPVVLSAPERLGVEKTPSYQDSDVTGVGIGGLASKEFEYEIEKDSAFTLPHSMRLYDEEYYAVGSSLPGTQPAEPFGRRLLAAADVGLGQVSIRLAAVARFDIAPPVEVATAPFALIDTWSKTRNIEFPVQVINRTPGRLAGALWVVPLALNDDEYEPAHIAFTREDEKVTIKLNLRLPILQPPLAPDVLLEFRREKPAPSNPLGVAKIQVKAIGFEIAEGIRAGYVHGLDDWLAFALDELGVEHTQITIDDINSIEHGNASGAPQTRISCGDLLRFNTIIVDRNAFLARPELILHNKCLLRYVQQGGSLIVLSQRPDDWNLLLSGSQFAPHPIKLSNDRITVETASVTILDPSHRSINQPNKITAKDFEGWSTERAVNVPREWSSEYKPLIESSEPGEEPSRGGLLIARSGEGAYIYTSLEWRRQLLAGNPGAYRLFANLVSLSKSKPAKPQ
ncbi:MAG: PIG-L family deacetylase [Blastocatellia bacterium]